MKTRPIGSESMNARRAHDAAPVHSQVLVHHPSRAGEGSGFNGGASDEQVRNMMVCWADSQPQVDSRLD